MGKDKSLIAYRTKPQCYEVYELLSNFCSKVFISCNAEQSPDIDPNYEKLTDLPGYAGVGPAAGVCTAFHSYPGRSFLVIGCDYPFLTAEEVRRFLTSIRPGALAAAFYDEAAQCYQPVLAWYSVEAGSLLREWREVGEQESGGVTMDAEISRQDASSMAEPGMIESVQISGGGSGSTQLGGAGRQSYSLQSFLKKINAYRYYPRDPASMRSIDTPAASAEARQRLNNGNTAGMKSPPDAAAITPPSNHHP